MRLIYDYKSFRDFLKDYYLEQKKKNPSFSYAVFSKQVGLSSPAHIQLILKGKRRLTVHNIHRMGVALGLPEGELDCFEALVHCEQAETPEERSYYERRLQHLHGDKPLSSTRLKASHLLSSGIFPALFLSIEGKTIEAASPAGGRFGYSDAETQNLIQQLLKEGVIELKENLIRISQRHLILHDKQAKSQAQKHFLLQQLKISEKAFHAQYDKEGKFFAHTFTFGPTGLTRYVDEIKDLMARITRISDEEPPNEVAQLNIQIFPYVRGLK